MIEKQNLIESELEKNCDEFISLIKATFTGERKEKLLDLYSEDNYGARIYSAPASSKTNFHGAFPGGYLIHIMHVINASKCVELMIKKMGGNDVIDYTEEERIFSAIHHDLGKLGDENGLYYLEEDNEWMKKNRKQVYKINPKLQNFDVADRSIYILQKNKIEMSWKEMLGIKLADGLYVESNKKYLITYDEDFQLKTILPHVIHTADLISCQTESRKYKIENS